MQPDIRAIGEVTGSTIYAVISNSSLLVWNGSSFVSRVSGNQPSYAVPLVETPAGSSIWISTFPTGIQLTGYYTVDYYRQLSSAPSQSDEIIGSEQIFYDGVAIVPPPTPPPISSPIRAVADFRGTFVQTTIGTLFLKIAQSSGGGADASQISLQITDQNDTPVVDANGQILNGVIPEKITDGYYFFDWAVWQNTPPGDYNVTWTYTSQGQTGHEYQKVTVASATSVNPQSLYAAIIEAFRESLSNMIAIAQYVPINHEQSRKSSAYTTYYFNFPRWIQSATTQIYLNNVPVESGITINYFRGYVIFDQPLTPYDIVTADYKFRWFSDQELDTFLSNAIGRYNTTTPFTNSFWNSLPPNWYGTILDIAASYAIRNLMMRLLTTEARLVFGGPEAAKELMGNLDGLKKNYEDQAKEQLANKKLGPYKGLTRMLTVPEYTLPGGRSRWFRLLFSGGS